jgi:predicted nucleic acid-binding protein
MKWVVDASVAVKWLIEEALSDKADLILISEAEIVIPDLAPIEVAAALSRKSREGHFPGDVAHECLDALFGLEPRVVRATRELQHEALQLSLEIRRSILDSLYLALAIREDCQMVTADKKFVDDLPRPHNERVVWVGSLSST